MIPRHCGKTVWRWFPVGVVKFSRRQTLTQGRGLQCQHGDTQNSGGCDGCAADHHALLEAHQFASRRGRSEEHTSELQSLMLHSYPVFCLTQTTPPYTINTPIRAS